MPNHLVNETSPYLGQHAGNPVDWYPWGEEALKRAREEDKPILLSIGYSACHWCHVMAHECFEDESIARLMNENFICIKVDREERPDLDHIYMQAVQAMTGGGGWPLTVFLTPRLKPFFGGTYFPPRESHNLPGFPQVLLAAADAYRNQRSRIDQSTAQMDQFFNAQSLRASTAAAALSENVLRQAFSSLEQYADVQQGGFGSAPKFPQPLTLEFLLRYSTRYKYRPALEMVELALQKMAAGGIYDQIGGGFHRYATDDSWQIPHFEKMLYDNALLSRLYLHAYQVTGKAEYAGIAEETLDYLLREMRSPQGGFYSAQDADSAGEEGLYYLWTPDEIQQALGKSTADAVSAYYAVTSRGNFSGRNILHRPGFQAEPDYIRQAKKPLLALRERRVKPGRDEKILADWNGLVLVSLAEAAGVLQRADYLEAAVSLGAFLLDSLLREGRLQHSFSPGRAGTDGFLLDYASVIDGLLALHRTTLESRWLMAADSLSQGLAALFLDGPSGLLFDTSSTRDDLIVRPRNTYDGVSPSGPSLACLVLLKMAALTGNAAMAEIGRKGLNGIVEDMQRDPLGHSQWLCGLDFWLSSPGEIVLAGDKNNPQTQEFSRLIGGAWLPHMIVAAFDPDIAEAYSEWPVFAGRQKLKGRTTVYICRHNTCRAPLTEAGDLAAALKEEGWKGIMQ